jgi:ATP-dependent Clp protease ATP-binding subunit ClpX
MDNWDLVFTDNALDAAAERALAQKTGARGLRTILEQALLDVMYELPNIKGTGKCVVDENAILGTSDVTLLNLKGEKLPLSYKEQKSA